LGKRRAKKRPKWLRSWDVVPVKGIEPSTFALRTRYFYPK
jgi:hypothetical protein